MTVMELIAGVALIAILLFMFLSALIADRADKHPYLGLAERSDMYDAGAVPKDCPECDGQTPVYERENSRVTCANCGALLDYHPDTDTITVEGQREPFYWT